LWLWVPTATTRGRSAGKQENFARSNRHSLPPLANSPGQPSNCATEPPQSPKAWRQFTPARRGFRRTRRHFSPARRNLKQYLKGQRKARVSRFPAGTKEFLPGTRERVEIRATFMESIRSHFPRWDKIACSQNALSWCIQYLKYHFNILIFEVPRGWRLNPRHSTCAQNVFLYRASGAVSSLPLEKLLRAEEAAAKWLAPPHNTLWRGAISANPRRSPGEL